MRWFTADFHVHTLLSPCAAVEMTPHNIVLNAVNAGVDIVAITDHNACDNVAAALEAARHSPVIILPGMELQTQEEVHLLAVFDQLTALVQFDGMLGPLRSGFPNDERRFGAQFVVDADDNLLRTREDLLLASVAISLEAAVSAIQELGGLAIASHVDRPAFSLIGQLGFIPPDVPFDALEISRRLSADAGARLPGAAGFPLIRSSDAHTIVDFLSGPKVRLQMEEASIVEIRRALRNAEGRACTCKSIEI